jgi:DNA-binding transcriptional MerR regulator
MTTGEVLNKISGLSKDVLYYWEARGYISPRKYQRGRVDKRNYSRSDFKLIAAMFRYYKQGFSPKMCYQKAIAGLKR